MSDLKSGSYKMEFIMLHGHETQISEMIFIIFSIKDISQHIQQPQLSVDKSQVSTDRVTALRDQPGV